MGIKTGSKGGGEERGVGRRRRQLITPPSKPVRPVENPYPEKKEWRLGVFTIREEKDDYLICRGFDPNAKDPFSHVTPSAYRTVKVAKPALLQRTDWDGESLEIDGITYTYEYTSVGVRTARWTDEDDEEQEREERIYLPYFVGDVIVAAQLRESRAVDGIDVDSEAGGRLSWVDQNGGARHWQVTDEQESNPPIFGALDSALSSGGNATLSVYEWNGLDWSDSGDNETVYDLFAKGGYAQAGAKVWAHWESTRGVYGAVWSARAAIFGTLAGNLTSGGSATLNIYKWNGSAWASSGNSITVYEALGLSSLIASGTKVWAEWEESRGVYVVTSASCA